MKRSIAHQSLTINVSRSEIEQHESKHGKYETRRSIPDGTLAGQVTLLIDVDALLRELGEKALRSKGGRAREAGGLIEAVVSKASLRRVK